MAFTAVEAYTDITYADAMIASEYPALLTDWDALTDAQQNLYLRSASDMIDRLQYVGYRSSSDQDRMFPRGGDTTIPDPIQRATVIIALAVWYSKGDADTVAKYLTITTDAYSAVVSEGFGDVSFSYSGGTGLMGVLIRQGYPHEAIDLLNPFLASTGTIRISRS